MAHLTAHPEAMTFAAAQLEGLGSSLAAENAAAATPTTGLPPAAADQVSALQAAIFSAYGAFYQSIAAAAHAVHEQFVQTLRTSSGSYTQTESINQAAATLSAAAPGNPIEWLSTILGGPSPSLNGNPFSLSGNAVNMLHTGMTNWVAATSDLLSLTGGGLIPATASGASAAGEAATAGALAVGVSPAVPTMSAAAVTTGTAAAAAGMGQAATAGRLSVPPSWASQSAASVRPTAVEAAWNAAPHTAPVATMPTGMPAVATAGRAGGYGGPRYGVRPKIMEKPAGL